MSLKPSQTELTARARADLRMGLPVVIEIAGTAALVVASGGTTGACVRSRRVRPCSTATAMPSGTQDRTTDGRSIADFASVIAAAAIRSGPREGIAGPEPGRGRAKGNGPDRSHRYIRCSTNHAHCAGAEILNISPV